MVAITMSPAPRSQRVPVTKKSRPAATAPTPANPPNSRAGRGERSVIAPTKIRKIAETIVAKVIVNGASEPGAMGMPSSCRLVAQSRSVSWPGQAAALAMVVM